MRAVGASPSAAGSLRVGRISTAVVTLIVAAAAISEGAVALGIVGLDASDGGWTLRGVLVFAAFCALFSTGPAFAVAGLSRFADGFRPGLPAVMLATAVLVVARYFSYDPYYAPDLIRMSEGGIVPGWWVAVLAALALASAAVSRRDVRAALLMAGGVMLLAGPTVLMAGLGH